MAIKTDVKLPSLLPSILGRRATSIRPIQIFMGIGALLFRFKYPATLKKLYQKCNNINSFLPNYVFKQNIFAQLVRGVIPPFLDQPPFSKIPLFLEIQDVPTFHMSIGKAKVLNISCNQFAYNFYPQSILILEECLQKW